MDGPQGAGNLRSAAGTGANRHQQVPGCKRRCQQAPADARMQAQVPAGAHLLDGQVLKDERVLKLVCRHKRPGMGCRARPARMQVRSQVGKSLEK